MLCRIATCHFFFFNDTATTEIYTLSLHDALPISSAGRGSDAGSGSGGRDGDVVGAGAASGVGAAPPSSPAVAEHADNNRTATVPSAAGPVRRLTVSSRTVRGTGSFHEWWGA